MFIACVAVTNYSTRSEITSRFAWSSFICSNCSSINIATLRVAKTSQLAS
jgi:hypothetical protein